MRDALLFLLLIIPTVPVSFVLLVISISILLGYILWYKLLTSRFIISQISLMILITVNFLWAFYWDLGQLLKPFVGQSLNG